MALNKCSGHPRDDSLRGSVRDALEAVEQIAASGWYPARRELLSHLAGLPRPDLPAWVPEADVEEGPREVSAAFALPGVEKGDIRVSVTETEVSISGKRRAEEGGPATRRLEQPRGEFLRRLRLPCEVKPESAKASYRNGVLRVTMARSRIGVGRSVKVE